MDVKMDVGAAVDNSPSSYAKQGENFACTLCDKTFTYKNGIIRHVRLTHGKEKPFECNICNRRFGYKNILMEHQNIHFGIKPYACNLCEKRFAARSNLVQHKMIHRKPFCCQICSKRFDKAEQLHRHVIGHPGSFLTCNLCTFITNNQSALNNHIQQAHDPQVLNTRDKLNSTIENGMHNQLNMSTSHSHVDSGLPQFGVAFASAPNQITSADSETMRKIDNICAQLATKSGPNLGDEIFLSDDIKSEPGEQVSMDVIRNMPLFPMTQRGVASRVSTPTIPTASTTNSSPIVGNDSVADFTSFAMSRADSSLNISEMTAVHSPSRSTSRMSSARIGHEQVPICADSTSSFSEMMSLLQNLTQKSHDLGAANFPRLSIQIEPLKSTREACTQFTTEMTSFPSLKEVLSYYESLGKLHRCEHCNILFEERAMYFLHASLHGKMNPWQCSICQTVCAGKNDFHLHFVNQQHCSM